MLKLILKIFANIILCCGGMCAISQSKHDTEEWLKYYINKFADYTTVNYSGYTLHQSFNFQDNMMLHYYKDIAVIMKPYYHDSLAKERSEIIYFSKVVKIDYSIDSSQFANHLFSINIRYNDKNFKVDKTGKLIYNFSDRNLIETGKNYIQLQYTFFIDDPNILKDNFPNRIVNALEHFAILNGAHLMKESF